MEGIEVIRVWVKTSPVKDFRQRMAFYLSYMVGAGLAGSLLAHGPYDLVYASSPPLFVGGAALWLSYLRRIPLVFEVRDLWPESAAALGEMSRGRAFNWATRLEEACYRRAKAIVAVTEGTRQRLIGRGIPAEKLWLVPNGANVEAFQFDPAGRRRIRDELGLGEQFVALYAGIHGVAQGLETVLDAAHALQGDPDISFLLVGEGPRKAALRELAQGYGLQNLRFLPEVPNEQMPAYLSAADAALVPLRKVELFEGVLPSKLFDAWASARPVVLSVAGEARRLLEEVEGGLYCPPEDPQGLAAAINWLRDHPQEAQAMGEHGRQVTVERFSRRRQAEQLAQALTELVYGKETNLSSRG